MASETIHITTPSGTAEAYVSRPDDADHPGVLFYVDAIGLRPRIEDMADRIASWGYVVLAPNPFYRDGAAADLAPTTDLRIAGNREKFFEGAMTRVRDYTADKSDPDLDAFLAALADLPGVSGPDVGLTGYCMGGRLAVRAAGLRPDVVAAAAAFHAAGLVTESEDSPHRLVAAGRAQILAGHADNDGSNPPEAIAAFEAALESAHLTYTSAIYPGAAHGYSMSDTSVYDEAATERHFGELQTLFAGALAT